MKKKTLILSALLVVSTSLIAQRKDVNANKVATKSTAQTTVNNQTASQRNVVAEIPSLKITADNDSEMQQLQKEQQQQLQENLAKSKAERAKRDAISEAVRKRLNKTQKRNRQ